MHPIRQGIAGALLILLAALPAAAQVEISTADIDRLRDQVFQAETDLSRLRRTDPTRAERLQIELDGLREEVIYLKVKMRKERNVSRSEYGDLRDRIQDVRTRARGETESAAVEAPAGAREERPAAAARPPDGPETVPVGTEIDARLQSTLDSGTAQVEDRFEATTVVDLKRGETVLVPAGSVMRGVVTSVDRAGRVDRKGSLTVVFDEITVRGKTYPIRGTVTQALESEGVRGEAARIGTGAGVGAVIGGILGGFKGALAGILIGGGGVIAATEGEDVELLPGTILRVRLDSALTVQ